MNGRWSSARGVIISAMKDSIERLKRHEENESFTHDVFLSHSSADKAVVRELAERLRGDGVRVWFDEWEIKLGDSIMSKIESALDLSRVLVLCMSKNAFGSDWAELESQTFRFRDPLNKQRRFIPVRLDDAKLPGSLAQFLYADWQGAAREASYQRLLDACRPAAQTLIAKQSMARQMLEERKIPLGHSNAVRSVAISPVGHLSLFGTDDNIVYVCDVESGRYVSMLEGHVDSVLSVAWSADGRLAISGSKDHSVHVWDVASACCVHVLRGHSDWVTCVASRHRCAQALSGSYDGTIRVWDVNSGECLYVLNGHSSRVNSLALSPDGRFALSASDDRTIRTWDIESGRCMRVLKGHSSGVNSVAWSNDDTLVLSGSLDRTVRVWDLESGLCRYALEGHKYTVYSVAWSADSRRAFTGSLDNTIREWDVESGRCVRVLKGHADSVLSVTSCNIPMRKCCWLGKVRRGKRDCRCVWLRIVGRKATPLWALGQHSGHSVSTAKMASNARFGCGTSADKPISD